MRLNLIDKMKMFPLKLGDFARNCKGYSEVLSLLYIKSWWYRGHLFPFNVKTMNRMKGLAFKVCHVLRYGED